MNNKKYIPYFLGAVLVVMGLYLITTYNGLVKKDEKVKVQWSEVQNAYQRRLDLIPNLANTVKAMQVLSRIRCRKLQKHVLKQTS